MRKVLTGVKSHEWFCILIPNMNQIALGDRSTAIYRAPNGWRNKVTGTCYVAARRRKAQKRAGYVGGFFAVPVGATSPSSQSCSLAKASQAASIRLYRKCKG